MQTPAKIVVTGAAGLVGQNLIPRLKARGFGPIVAIDKHPANTKILRELHPDIMVIEADLAVPGAWADAFAGADTLVLNHAQIGALEEKPFIDNNITASEQVVAAAKKHAVPHVVHISSSVVNSLAHDYYTETKKAQEALVVGSGLSVTVLRPTLMFGWFDRKHLGWLARFMQRAPVFPVPGSGRYLRQPLYVGDFCGVIMACIETPRPGEAFNISGQSKIDYIDLIREVKAASGARAPIVRIPYALFWTLLKTYALVDRDPPFTTSQLKALVTPDVFEVIDWPGIFGVRATPLPEALKETFQDPVYSKVVLEF
ncbi:NAD(P)-dependent oxidoreductase [Bosea sp. 117]|uniref:NAD-dependent epimerase/dehydratase family protein n=1 Tax=Bosea sp. 117 TaxID=1125973 RepID=UPI0004947F47|nr:NAD(P)-dependent oxidoreductase [Bosea sp. 117]